MQVFLWKSRKIVFFNPTRACLSYCAQKCKDMTSSIISDVLCILNYDKAQKVVRIALIFRTILKSCFLSRFFDYKNQKRFEVKIACNKIARIWLNFFSFLFFLLCFDFQIASALTFLVNTVARICFGSNIWLLFRFLQPQNYMKKNE